MSAQCCSRKERSAGSYVGLVANSCPTSTRLRFYCAREKRFDEVAALKKRVRQLEALVADSQVDLATERATSKLLAERSEPRTTVRCFGTDRRLSQSPSPPGFYPRAEQLTLKSQILVRT
jgi:hypothetical protein